MLANGCTRPPETARIRINFYDLAHAARKTQSQRNALELFVGRHPGYESRVGIQETLEQHLAAVASDLQDAPDGDIVFAPMGSEASDQFSPPAGISRMAFMEVTASHKLHDRMKLVSTFLPAERYADGLAEALLPALPRPKRVHFLRNAQLPYFETVQATIASQLAEKGLRVGESYVSRDPRRDPGARRFLKSLAGRKDDWLVLVDFGPDIHPLLAEVGLPGVHKIFLYGFQGYEANLPALPSSTEVLYWLPGYGPAGESADACAFHGEFSRRYGHRPEFHAAYLYASLEVADWLRRTGTPFERIAEVRVPTVLGTFRWDSRGRPLGTKPIFVLHDAAKKISVVSPGRKLERCREEKKKDSGVIGG